MNEEFRIGYIGGCGHGKNYAQAVRLANEVLKILSSGKIKAHLVIEVQESDAMVRLRKYEEVEKVHKFIIDEMLGDDWPTTSQAGGQE